MISFVIPTRNGQPYLAAAVSSVLEHGGSDCELIVSVNRSEDDSLNVLQRISDDRLKVVVPPCVLPMADNFEFAITQATGDWVAVLGDDDGIVWNFREDFELVLQKAPQAEVVIARRAYCFWPGVEDLYGAAGISYQSRERIRSINGKSLVSAVLLGSSPFVDLPHLYTGSLIKRSVLERFAAVSSDPMFRYSIPDVYSGIAISLLNPEIIRTETPLFWIGTSPKSNGYVGESDEGSANVTVDPPNQPKSGSQFTMRTEFLQSGAERDHALHGDERHFPVIEMSLEYRNGPLYAVAAFLAAPRELRRRHLFGRFPRIAPAIGLAQSLRSVRAVGGHQAVVKSTAIEKTAHSIGIRMRSIRALSTILGVSISLVVLLRKVLDSVKFRMLYTAIRVDQQDALIGLDAANDCLQREAAKLK